jgi:hypothetical protein
MKKINEDLHSLLVNTVGIITAAVTIKLFGKKIFLKIVEQLLVYGLTVKDKLLFKTIIDLLINHPENLVIKYKKNNDHYQIYIDLRDYNNDMIFTDGSNPFKNVRTDDFPVKMKIYENDSVVMRHFLPFSKKIPGIYSSFVEFLKSNGDEDNSVRDQDEYSDLMDLMRNHLGSWDDNYEESLSKLKEENLNSLSEKISKLLNINEEIVLMALKNVIHHNVGKYKHKNFGSLVNNIYDNVVYLHNKTLTTESTFNNNNRKLKMNKILINEKELKQSIRKHLIEQDSKKEEDQKPRCVAGNVIPLDMMVGPSDKFDKYTSTVLKRDGGINGMVDTLDVLRTLRLHPGIEDSGEHLSYNLMNHINTFRNKNYFDETNSECLKAMDKVIELYKENEHGEDLVKDIEKVLAHKDPSPRAKEYLKRCLILVKDK